MFVTHTYMGVTKGKMNYLFFLLTEDYIEKQSKIRETLQPLLIEFACDLKETGALVKPFPEYISDTRRDVLWKFGTSGGRKAIEKRTPGILVINVDFDKFNPSKDSWVYFSLRDSMNEYGDIAIFELKELFSILTQYSKRNLNIFKLGKDMAKAKKLQSLGECFELKLGKFGFSFNVKRGVEFLKSLSNV